MSNHTPAPWYAAMCDTIRGQEPRIRDTMPAVRSENGGKEICVLTNYNHADAQLIASAPELLEALESLFNDYKELADSGDAGFWKLEETETGKKALKAIAKAKEAE